MKLIYSLLPFLLLFTSISCETKTGSGALGGAVVGTVVGGVAGGGTGALIGAGAGAVGGAIVGAALDAQDKDRMGDEAYNEYNEGIPLTVDRVIDLTKKGIEPEKIILMMKNTGSMYCDLTKNDVRKMKAANVDHKVIKYMKQSCDP
jgi:outer membrane lipoprotein SlyB